MPLKGPKKKANWWFSKRIENLGLNITSNVVEISKSNSCIIEADINKNPDFNSHFTKKICQYHLARLQGNQSDLQKDKEAIHDIVRMIDIENSTNAWRYKTNQLDKMVDYMVDPRNGFWDALKKGNIDLVEKLRKSSGATAQTDGPKSLASKICKYCSEIFYSLDHYYINDKVIRHVLPYYFYYYANQKSVKFNLNFSIDKMTEAQFNNASYEDLFKWLDELKSKTCPCLTKNELDHILWYCYRYQKQ